MRVFVAAGILALVGASGACAALDGLGDYQECVNTCADTSAGSNDADSHVVLPTESGESTDDSAAPVEEETPPPADDEAGGGGDANFNDVSTPRDAEADAPGHVVEAGPDAPFDSGMEAAPPPMTGATCGPKGTSVRCYANQTCCANLSAQTNACASSCPSNASLSCATASDCPSSTPICCANVTFTADSQNDPPPKCAVTTFTATCASSCLDVPPASCTLLDGTIRLCTHDADCASDPLSPQCWNYNNAPESWCTSQAAGQAGGGVHQP
jgi:hypothetical protein